jgi:2-dehydro-3-deoxyphosphogluconate aldolase/(4S)-4-hydroxy-2-oxoglutarate aldolase
MKRIGIIQKIVDIGIVAIVRTESKASALKTVEAIREGGINAIEVTMTVPGALDIIKEISETYDDIILGAGTVLDPETARECILAGATYIICPHLNYEVINLCNRYRVPVMPGVMTVKEAIEAMELGVEILKVFPGSAFNPSIVKAIKGPLPQANLMPTGGVNLDNVADWVKNGAIAVGVGGSLTKDAKTGDYERITEKAKEFVKRIEDARN